MVQINQILETKYDWLVVVKKYTHKPQQCCHQLLLSLPYSLGLLNNKLSAVVVVIFLLLNMKKVEGGF